MTVQKRGVNKSQTGKSKKPTFKKKGRSVPSLIKKNRRDLKKLKHEESSAEDDSASSDLDVDDDTIQMVTSNNRSDNHGESASVSDSDESDSNILNSSDKEDAVDLFNEIEHKKSLSKLKETDPEFYRFLEENDKKLLQFDVSGSDSEVESEDDKVHQPPRDLEDYVYLFNPPSGNRRIFIVCPLLVVATMNICLLNMLLDIMHNL